MSIHNKIMQRFGVDEETYSILDMFEKKELIARYLKETTTGNIYDFLIFFANYLFIYLFIM